MNEVTQGLNGSSNSTLSQFDKAYADYVRHFDLVLFLSEIASLKLSATEKKAKAAIVNGARVKINYPRGIIDAATNGHWLSRLFFSDKIFHLIARQGYIDKDSTYYFDYIVEWMKEAKTIIDSDNIPFQASPFSYGEIAASRAFALRLSQYTSSSNIKELINNRLLNPELTDFCERYKINKESAKYITIGEKEISPTLCTAIDIRKKFLDLYNWILSGTESKEVRNLHVERMHISNSEEYMTTNIIETKYDDDRHYSIFVYYSPKNINKAIAEDTISIVGNTINKGNNLLMSVVESAAEYCHYRKSKEAQEMYAVGLSTVITQPDKIIEFIQSRSNK